MSTMFCLMKKITSFNSFRLDFFSTVATIILQYSIINIIYIVATTGQYYVAFETEMLMQALRAISHSGRLLRETVMTDFLLVDVTNNNNIKSFRTVSKTKV